MPDTTVPHATENSHAVEIATDTIDIESFSKEGRTPPHGPVDRHRHE